MQGTIDCVPGRVPQAWIWLAAGCRARPIAFCDRPPVNRSMNASGQAPSQKPSPSAVVVAFLFPNPILAGQAHHQPPRFSVLARHSLTNYWRYLLPGTLLALHSFSLLGAPIVIANSKSVATPTQH
nr:hypothetical protein FVER53263_20428 [Fusarium verticillioides]